MILPGWWVSLNCYCIYIISYICNIVNISNPRLGNTRQRTLFLAVLLHLYPYNQPVYENNDRIQYPDEQKYEKKRNNKAITLEGSHESAHFLRKKRVQDLGTIQWRQRHEVENSQNQVDQNSRLEQLYHIYRYTRPHESQIKAGHNGDKDIRERAGKGYESLPKAAILEIIGVYRHRLCPA